jgi:hypothetical protein
VEGETETGWWMGGDPSRRTGSTPYREEMASADGKEMAGAQKQRRYDDVRRGEVGGVAPYDRGRVKCGTV